MSVIDKSILRFTICYDEVSQEMTNSDLGGQISLSHPHTNTGFFL